ncbi:MAG: lycopene cyclase domain-containing protein [Bacteroidota bacterium]
MEPYYYLLLDLFTISFPLVRSFEHRIQYARKWKALFPAILITGAFFVIWDVVFTARGVWGFNSRYLIGTDIINLPLEEWLFFIVVPFSCVFIYECVKYFKKPELWPKTGRRIGLALAIFLLVIGILNIGKAYTSFTFLALAAFLLMHVFVFKSQYLGTFFFSYSLILIPFLMINGILTGSFIEGEIVWYNDAENLGIRIFTIPIEDTFYGMLLILMNVSIYENIMDYFSAKKRVLSN